MRHSLKLSVFVLLLSTILPKARGDGATDREVTALGEAQPLLALPLEEAPGATTVITSDEIARSAAANIFELLRRVPGIDIRYTPMGGHIAIRGTGSSPFSEEVLLLIDGSPYNSPDKGGFPGHPNYTGFFPLDRIARIEIVKGPVSVLYGANAFGGVINIVSKQAADAVTDRIEGFAYGGTLLAGDRKNLERSIRAALIRGGWQATFEAGLQDGDTPIMLNGEADHSRYDLYAAVRRGNFWGSVLHHWSRYGSLRFGDIPTKVATHDVDIVDTHYQRRVGGFVLRGSATLNRYRGTTCAECHNSLSKAPDDAVTNDVGSIREVDQRMRLALRADRVLTDRQDLTIGVEAARDSVDRPIVRLPGAPSVLDNSGAFLQHQWHLFDRSLHVLSGVRIDSAQRLGRVTSPRAALVYEPAGDVALHASWSRAFRAPTWNERFIRQRFEPEEAAPDTIVVFQGDPDLKRERIDSAQAGLSWRLNPDLVVKVDLYHNRIFGFIYREEPKLVPGSPNEILHEYENRERAFTIRGGEITLINRPVRSLSLTAAFATRDLSLSFDDPVAAYAPRSRAMLTAAWNPVPRWSFDLAGSYSSSYTGSLQDEFGPRPQPSYQLFDGAVRYTLPAAKGTWSFGLIGRNLLGKHPRETVVDPEIDTSLRGRVVALELKADF